MEAWRKTCGRSRRREKKEEPYGHDEEDETVPPAAEDSSRPSSGRLSRPLVSLILVSLVSSVARSGEQAERTQSLEPLSVLLPREERGVCAYSVCGGGQRCARPAPPPPSLAPRFLLEEKRRGAVRWDG